MRAERILSVLLPFLISLAPAAAAAPELGQCASARYEGKPRVFVCTDISNEPDDQMSLVRFLTYSNELDIQGIAAVTSTWLNSSTDEPTVRAVIDAYGEVTTNLNANVPSSGQYPTAAELQAKVHAGHPVYGLAALKLNMSNGAQALLSAADASTPEKPIWVALWAGASVLAEVLNNVTHTRNEHEVATLLSKMRVYSISDQDDAGVWIRNNYPTLSYVNSIHGFSQYTQATWIGISGEIYYHFDKGGPNNTLATNEWLQTNIRKGPLGAKYLNFSFIMEGDTPSFLPLIQNGLGDIRHPEWGSWGGRYMPEDASGKTNVYAQAADFALGVNGETFLSAPASIWRWRPAYQYDFAARMSWSVSGSYAENNHQPVVVVNDTCGLAAMQLHYRVGQSFIIDASKSYDPDGDKLVFNWLYYQDAEADLNGNLTLNSPDVTINKLSADGSIVCLEPNVNKTMHVILELSDDRSMPLTTYRRVILYPQAS